MGGSPCTHWSIAQTKHRETEPSGSGWELFKNYLIALQKYRPDYFIYENNKSMSVAIQDQISQEFGVPPVCIDSALVSAQTRKRLYWVGRRNKSGSYDPVPIEQPEDRGILLRDILESGEDLLVREKSYALLAVYGKASAVDSLQRHRRTMVAEPVRVGTIESGVRDASHDSRQYRVYSTDSKSVTLRGQGGGVGAKTGLYAVPMPVREATKKGSVEILPGECVDLGMEQSLTRRGRRMALKCNCCTARHHMYEYMGAIDPCDYEVVSGQITIKGKQYPVKLRDGRYVIRKLTVKECMRLQTVPEDYVFPVSKTQAYKMLGNGWTVDVIVHILKHFDGIETEPVEVLSMYDGMSCGQIALKKLGADVRRYFATEIDTYCVQTTQANFPETVQLGDAFQVREDAWSIGENI